VNVNWKLRGSYTCPAGFSQRSGGRISSRHLMDVEMSDSELEGKELTEAEGGQKGV
jgi:hypothetical protein